MNTVERIVARYFEMVRQCLTVSDVKVPNGNNRQFDLLAMNLIEGTQYHVESGVTHEKSWWPTLAKIEKLAREKFFGVPKPPKQPAKKNQVKKESYLLEIKKAYGLYGFEFQSLRRVCCCWTLKDCTPIDLERRLAEIAREFGVANAQCEVLSLRDQVIPELTNVVGRSNYDDDVLRMLSLLEQRRLQSQDSKPRTDALRGPQHAMDLTATFGVPGGRSNNRRPR